MQSKVALIGMTCLSLLALPGGGLVPDMDWIWMESAYAARNLSPSEINMQTIAGRADFARFLYFIINGPTVGYTIPGLSDGFTGLINNITAGVGKRLEAEGYKGCESIPTSGSFTKNIQTKDGEVAVTLSFSTGSKTVPTHFGKYSGQTFSKRIEITRSSEKFMALELQCDTDSKIRTGYILTSGTQFGKRNFEVYFQNDLNSKAGYVDLMHISSELDSEKLAVRFKTVDGDAYEMWIIRTTTDGGAYFGLSGSASAKKAQINGVRTENVLTDTTPISTATYKDCVDFSSDTAVEGSGCSAVSDPSGEIKYNSTSLNWTIAGIAGASISQF